MAERPIDHTVVGGALWDGEHLHQFPDNISYYKDVTDPLNLPWAALWPATIDEWATYKKWEIDQIALEAKRKFWKDLPLHLRHLYPNPDAENEDNSRVQVGGWGFPADVAKKIMEDSDG